MPLLLFILGAGRVTCKPMKLVGKKGVGKNEALNSVGTSPVISINLFLLISGGPSSAGLRGCAVATKRRRRSVRETRLTRPLVSISPACCSAGAGGGGGEEEML